ncbi:MAG TPA: peptidoglycan-binding domain-containing protein, partial [Coleofasciculaceae cyanobacterium]
SLTHRWLVRTGAIACLGLALVYPSVPSPAQTSSAQTSSAQTSSAPAGQGLSGSTPTAGAAATPGNRPILNQGSQGESVSELQALLKLLGFYSGAVDGIYRDDTASAVAAFQQSAGLQSDGIVGSDTWTRLLPPSPATSPDSPAAAGTSPVATPVRNPTGSGTTNTASTNTASTNTASNSNVAELPAAATPSTSFPSPTGLPTLSPSPTGGTASPAATTPPAAAPSPSPAPTPATTTPRTDPSSTPAPSAPTTVDLPILKVGMRGSAVSGLQERLKAIGIFNGAIDGIFGTETEEAVKTAQRNFGLDPDGIVGPATWTALLR